MTVDTLIILSGALVILLPFLGFPDSWDTVIFFVLGSLIVGLGIVIRRRKSSSILPHSDDIRSE
ncbi:hypothetical protein K8R03_03345 [Candidatus Kaiserbacteria bacterium]|nr:hypothetical protein [Candidatus Kaiserbacteria bacterium]